MAAGLSSSTGSRKMWRDKQKMKTPLGTFTDHPFHASLIAGQHENDENDDDGRLPIELYSDILPYYCLPMCGVYGTDDYHLTDPVVLLLLPSLPILQKMESLFSSHLIAVIREHVSGVQSSVEINSERFLVAVLVHSLPNLQCGVDPDNRDVNVMYHTWAFKGSQEVLTEPDPQLTLLVGAFSPFGVLETAQNVIDELNGLTVNRLAPKIQYMHDGVSLSPHNAQLSLEEGFSVHSFYSFAKNPLNGKTVLTYHIIPSTEGAERRLNEAVDKSCTVGELVKELKALEELLPDLSTPLNVVSKLLETID